MEKELLRRLGEETLYSAKGHFKALDVRRQIVTYTIWFCAVINIFGFFDLEPLISKGLSAFGVLGTIALLIWNEGEGKNYRARHKEVAEKYLALHKELRRCFFLGNCDATQVTELNNRVTTLDQSEKPDIPGIAKWMAKRAIEGKDPETDNWFK